MRERTTNFEDVHAIHEKFDMPHGGEPHLLDVARFSWRYEFMREELREMLEAFEKGDLPNVADALVDLVVVALGTAVEMGLPWQLLWDDVHRANMSKVRGKSPGREASEDGDLIKPEGWVPPQTGLMLAAYLQRVRSYPHAWRPTDPSAQDLMAVLIECNICGERSNTAVTAEGVRCNQCGVSDVRVLL